ncbi:hypothetical protein [Rubripirellula lacrimiformis]|uniref:hypothetical protein n=1 Tax=Rubripirellula lacrimiformis TaxID=1930273 RepID=UPI0011A83CA6|nr:hypothetical protein [Rubripirellula lacrimiformis]
MLLPALAGCHRQFYRQQADNEAHLLIAEKSSHVARPPNEAVRIEVDRRSRMFNPFDLDFQPMPLDDPASYRYMQCVDGRRGYPMWEAAGLTNTTESPDWWQFLPLDDDGVLVLNLENAVQIALLHSPDYQQQVEQLYLSALQVSAERFQFDTQFFGGAQTSLTADGPGRRGAGGNSSTQFEIGPNSNGRRDLALQRKFATGGELIAGVANSIVWELSGPNSQSATTVLDFTLLQPLLRNAGRDKVLEDLTFAERALLANVRAFERYRRSFYLNITVGRSTESTLRGGGFSASGLGNNIASVGAGSLGNAGGYLGLLQTQLQIRNLEENIARQTEFLLVLEDSLIELKTTIPDSRDSIARQTLQVAQARSSLLRSQSQLVNQQANYQRTVDSFLRTLGLPPYICAKLNDPILEQFELIDRTLLTRREELSILRSQVGILNVAILGKQEFNIEADTELPVSSIQWSDDLAEMLEQLREELEPLAEFNRTLIGEDLIAVAKDVETFNESLALRQKQNKELLKVYRTEQQSICGLLNVSEVDESIFDIEELVTLGPLLKTQQDTLSKRFHSYTAKIDKLQTTLQDILDNDGGDRTPLELNQILRDDLILASQNLLSDLGDDVLALQLIQARARTEKVVLPTVDIAPENAFEIARRNRRDLANARASLVDTWRAIEVSADDLESTLDVVFSGDVQNTGNNPLDLRSNTGRLRVGLQWDAPITRLLERNAYRTSLIRYEQAKRDYYGLEDSIWQVLRAEVRQLQANRLTFELGRQSVRIAAAQIELNTDIRAINEADGRPAGPTAARDAISALTDLLDAQNGLLNIFVNYEVVRRGLDFDLGTMEITPEGLWIEPGELSPEYLLSLPGVTAGGMIDGQCNTCCLPYDRLPPEPTFKNFLQTSALSPVDSEGNVDLEQVFEADEAVLMNVDPLDDNPMPTLEGDPSTFPNSQPVTIDAIPSGLPLTQ